MRTITSRTLKNVAGAPQRSVHAHFIFRFENGPGNQSFFFYPRPKYSWNESTTSSAGGRLTRHEQGVSARPQAALRKSLIQHGLVEKKKKNRQTSWIKESFCWKATILKKANTTDLERDLQRTRLRRSTNDWRRRTWAPSAGQSGCFFCFFFSTIV